LSRLRNAFLSSAAVRFVFDHSEKIAAGGFIAGHLGLILPSGFSPGVTAASGALFIMADLALTRAKKNPVAAFRTCGLFGLAAVFCLSAGGINFDTMQVENSWRVISPLFALPTLTLIGMQNEIAGSTEKHLNSPNRLMNAFANACQYPLLLGAVTGLTSGTGLMISAIIDQNVALMGVLGLWALGGTGLVLSDPRLQKFVREKQQVPEAAPLWQAGPKISNQ